MIINLFKGEHYFLSNFAECEIIDGDLEFPTVEHAYQAMKTDDLAKKRQISIQSTPGKAKRLGQRVPVIDNWEEIKLDVMMELLVKKFSSDNPELRQKLIDTEDSDLMEGNTWHDQFWGDCSCNNHAGTDGENWLGKLLMEIREGLQS
tara:strand:+ start:2368 stop:2811 length:444 start_codon:yes stop_codon:yes gene_type:complete